MTALVGVWKHSDLFLGSWLLETVGADMLARKQLTQMHGVFCSL